MPKDGGHIEHSLFPGVCSDSWFAEVLAGGVSSIISMNATSVLESWINVGRRLKEEG